MRGHVVISLILVSITTFIINTSEARGFDDLTKDQNYIHDLLNCVLEIKECDEYGSKVKAIIPEAINNNCKRCNTDQKRQTKLMSGFMKIVYPDLWKEIQNKYRANNYIHTDY